ncbi:hypothetical protein CI109_105815 [Kwoniella shandongensis]|uniref:Uncharacterized protein n=1 Tax=Kwoniella shandongensis TaxID=1734106 RepID=A0A5M6C486_9TREE|nr:uncharacterized protein CI109_003154 [Kwoniella shandongensis]KAA5528622.1 hypothetical protein CI109_003154 [Kwoniella shandongensis]
MSLSLSQEDALDQLCAITATDSTAARERNERLLRENGWNVQATVEQIFSMEASDPPPRTSSSSATSPSSLYGGTGSSAAHLEVEDPLLPRPPPGARRLSGSHRPHRAAPGTGGVGLGVLGLITRPISLLLSIVGGVWYFFVRTFIPLSFLPRFPSFLLPPATPTSSTQLRPLQDPTTTSLAFIRELERFTRCSAATGTLPEFYIGPYREFVTTLRKEGKLGLVVLVSAEHEDDEEFKRDVLCDEEFIRTLKEKEVLIWGADISSREGYQASQTLLTTTYPSLTFLSLLPHPSSSTPRLSILSNLAGPPSTTTSTTSILQTLTTSILPRTTPFLTRLKRERLSLEESRHLREEQDRAFQEAERKDREKLQLQRQKEELERIQRERAERELREKELAKERRKVWRRYARRNLLPPSEGSVRIALRTPISAERNMRQFQPSSSTLPLFIYAETLLISAEDKPESDPTSPPEGYDGPDWMRGDTEALDFRIVTAYPRKEVECVTSGGEAIWELMKGSGGALFAEKKEGCSWGEVDGADSDDEEIVSDSD